MSTELKPNNTGLLAEKREGEIHTVPPLDKQGNTPTWPEDLEKSISTASPPMSPTKHDKRPKKSCIEYAPVDDDPRQWSTAKKVSCLLSRIATLFQARAPHYVPAGPIDSH